MKSRADFRPHAFKSLTQGNFFSFFSFSLQYKGEIESDVGGLNGDWGRKKRTWENWERLRAIWRKRRDRRSKRVWGFLGEEIEKRFLEILVICFLEKKSRRGRQAHPCDCLKRRHERGRREETHKWWRLIQFSHLLESGAYHFIAYLPSSSSGIQSFADRTHIEEGQEG